jgi:hypothetical protein
MVQSGSYLWGEGGPSFRANGGWREPIDSGKRSGGVVVASVLREERGGKERREEKERAARRIKLAESTNRLSAI